MTSMVQVGTAGWSLPKTAQARFPLEGTHLQRYASVFPAVEINSSFYRPHRPSTYERWAASVPANFRFSVKVPKTVTHERRLVDVDEPLARFLDESSALGEKLGCLLVQLPPSLGFDGAVVGAFLARLRKRHGGMVALEPRHRSWFTAEANALLVDHAVTRVAADPAVVPDAAMPGGDPRAVYYRLHGSPRIYYSAYEDEVLERVAAALRADAATGAACWCIFDNTALGAATSDALAVMERVAG